jgi:ActR/RegA family two-component response regulator
MSAREKPKATILLIDDEQIVHESVRRILESAGYRVDGAFRVAEALDRLRWQSYDLVLTDLMMPDDSGMKAVEAVARDHPNCGVVMFTGYATVESAVESIKLGALDYLPKPFTPDELTETIQKALDKTLKGRRDREIESTFAEAEKAIKSSLDLKEVLNLICMSVVKLLKIKGSAVAMRDRKNDKLEIVAQKGLSDEYLSKGAVNPKQSVPIAIESGEVTVVNEPDFDSFLQYPDAARKEGIASIMVVPLKINETILGFLRLYASEKLSLSNEENEILFKFSDQAAQALENAMAYERIRTDIEGLRTHIPSVVPEKEAK